MSVSAIPSSAFFTPQNIQTTFQRFQQEFQQLGQHLQSGNLSAAQSDFANLKNFGVQTSTTTSRNNSPIAQAFNQLAKDLQSATFRRSAELLDDPSGFRKSIRAGPDSGTAVIPSPSWRRIQ